jgi:uncharacterized repeat protein (TIGR01451 family)
MNKSLKAIIISLSLVSLAMAIASRPSLVKAQYGTGEEERQVIIDKKVKPVNSDKWYDNLPQVNTAFAPEDLVDFKIILKNSGDVDLENLNIIDNLPDYVKPIFNPGEYKEDEKKITWTIKKISTGETQEFNIRVQIGKAENISQTKPFCLVNKAGVQKDGQELDNDTAQFCIEPRILAKTFPETGFNMVFATLVALVTVAAGVLIRKIGRGEIL